MRFQELCPGLAYDDDRLGRKRHDELHLWRVAPGRRRRGDRVGGKWQISHLGEHLGFRDRALEQEAFGDLAEIGRALRDQGAVDVLRVGREIGAVGGECADRLQRLGDIKADSATGGAGLGFFDGGDEFLSERGGAQCLEIGVDDPAGVGGDKGGVERGVSRHSGEEAGGGEKERADK